MADFRRALRRTDKELPRQMRLANKEAAEAAVPYVKREVPVATGRLRNTVRALATQSRAQVSAGTPARVPYARVINFGWPARNIRPQEYMYKGLREAYPKLRKAYLSAVDRLAKRAFPR